MGSCAAAACEDPGASCRPEKTVFLIPNFWLGEESVLNFLFILWLFCAWGIGFLFGLWWKDRKAAVLIARLRESRTFWQNVASNVTRIIDEREEKDEAWAEDIKKSREGCLELERELRKKGDELDANYHLGKAAGYAAALIELQGRI